MSNIEHVRHSLAHLLAAAGRELYPKAKNAIGPAVEHGFYQDFELPRPISDEELPAIEAKMRELMKTWSGFEKREVTPRAAKKEFAWNRYKCELIDEFSKAGKKLTFYTAGGFVDLCRGGHVKQMKEIDPQAFTLTKVAGAYWRGNAKNKMLTRIYGAAFATKKELDEYMQMLKEAERRDHKK